MTITLSPTLKTTELWTGRSMSVVTRAHGVSDDGDGSAREWRRSSRSYGGGQCVEAAARHGASIDVRDSKDPQGAVLSFPPAQWNAFVAGVRSGALGL